MGADITVTAGSLVASFRIPRPFPSSLSLSLDTSSSLDSCITVHSFVYNPLPSTRRNACTRFRTRPPKIYEKILSFFEISFRSFSRRKFRRLFFLSGFDVYIINSGREMIFESRYTIPFPREITTRFLKLDPFPLPILSRFDRAKHFLFVCKKKRKLFFFSQLENRYTNPLRYL